MTPPTRSVLKRAQVSLLVYEYIVLLCARHIKSTHPPILIMMGPSLFQRDVKSGSADPHISPSHPQIDFIKSLPVDFVRGNCARFRAYFLGFKTTIIESGRDNSDWEPL